MILLKEEGAQWEDPLTSLAMVVMKAGGLAVAMSDRACLAERAESAAGLKGSPIVMLNGDQKRRRRKKRKAALEIETEKIRHSL